LVFFTVVVVGAGAGVVPTEPFEDEDVVRRAGAAECEYVLRDAVRGAVATGAGDA
jgi:hypothetical protein